MPSEARRIVSSRADIVSALNAGVRWLVIDKDPIGFDDPIDLDTWTTDRSLHLEGAGPHRTNINPTSMSALPFFHSEGSPWRLYFYGINFNGGKEPDVTAAEGTLCDFVDVTEAVFVNCAFRQAKSGHGLRIGQSGQNPGFSLRLINCQLDRNDDHNMRLEGVGDFTIIGGTCERSGQRGFYIRGASGSARTGSIIGLHLEYNGMSDQMDSLGLILDNIRLARIVNGHFLSSRIQLLANTNDCLIENNILWDNAESNQWIDDAGSGNDLLDNTFVTGSNQDFMVCADGNQAQ